MSDATNEQPDGGRQRAFRKEPSDAVDSMMVERDKRYAQLFEAQERAVNAALAALQRETMANLESIKDKFHAQEGLQIERVQQLRRETDEVRDQAAKQFQALAELKANELLSVERVESLRREAEQARQGAEAAISKVDIAQEKRFEGVNEFRAQLSDQAATFVSRNEVDAKLAAMVEKVDDLKSRVQAMESRQLGARQQGTDSRAVMASAIGVVLFIITVGGILAARTP